MGVTPSTSRKPGDTSPASTCSRRSPSVIVRMVDVQAYVASSVSFISDQSTKLSGDTVYVSPSCVSRVASTTRRSGSGYGSGRRRTPFTTLKTAVFAPIPSASVTRTTAVGPGLDAKDRTA